jgi:hypothetical protein
MKLPNLARPITRTVGTAKFLRSGLVQPLSLRCSTEGEICGRFTGGSCCNGLQCLVLPGADSGYCYRPTMVPMPGPAPRPVW